MYINTLNIEHKNRKNTQIPFIPMYFLQYIYNDMKIKVPAGKYKYSTQKLQKKNYTIKN